MVQPSEPIDPRTSSRDNPPTVSPPGNGFLKSPKKGRSHKKGILIPACTIARNVPFETIGAAPIPPGTIRNLRHPAISLEVVLVRRITGRKIKAHALFDSGAERMAIDKKFAKRNKLSLRELVHPIPVRNVDRSANKDGSIKYSTLQKLRIEREGNFHKETSEFYVTALGDQDILFGTDWLKTHNPEVDWQTETVRFTRCPETCHIKERPFTVEASAVPTPGTKISRIDIHEEYDLEPTFEEEGTESLVTVYRLQPEVTTIRRKTTTSTEIAKETELRLPPALPREYRKYSKVFSEEASQRLPKHQPWDQAIDLKPDATMRKTRVYRLTPIETEVLKVYIH